MKSALFLFLLALTAAFAAPEQDTAASTARVFFTKEISPDALVRMFDALERPAHGKVAVKISTGEAGGNNFLQPWLISNLVAHVNGTIVECNTAYAGKRASSKMHWETIKEHGFLDIAHVEILDENGEIEIPVKDKTHIKSNLVGAGITNYTFMVNLAHFKGHQMGGFGGVLKNQSIGVASANGKARIHTAGKTSVPVGMWGNLPKQDYFLESMAAAAQSVHDYFKGTNIVYINVMNNMSIDCDCSSHPEPAKLADIGILASTDPVALDRACVDLVRIRSVTSKSGDDNRPLLDRIKKQHGEHIITYSEKIGLGTTKYVIVDLDKPEMTQETARGLITAGKAECVVLRNGRVAAIERGKGVSPLKRLYDNTPEVFSGATIVDKVIGRAAAFIAILGGAQHVHGEVMSEPAVELLTKYNISASWTQLVPQILNRKRDGLCPLEASVQGFDNPQQAFDALRVRIAELMSAQPE